jgi:peptidyl-prolyl cis-trans isomerase D
MMQALRNNTKIIIWIIVIAFVGTIVFAWGMDIARGKGSAPTGVVGVVNGKEIPLNSYGQQVDQIIESERQKDPQKDFTDSDYRDARRQAWNDFVVQAIQSQQIAKRGIQLTDNELVDFIKRYPPQEIVNIQQFQTDGQFDYKKYLSAMSDPSFRQLWIQVEALMRPRIRDYKLQEYIGSLVRVSNLDIQNEYIRNNERMKVKYGLVPLKSFEMSSIAIDSQQVQDYYDNHPEEFHQEEVARYTVYRVPKKPSERDNDRAFEDATDIKREIDAGGDFEKIANDRTQDPSGKGKGGDLGWFGPGRMVAPFDSAVFAMKVGEVSPPVKTNFGYHIIKKIETRKAADGTEEVHAAHILIKPQISQETLDAEETRLDRFREEVSPDSLDAKMKEYDISADPQRKLSRDDNVAGMGNDHEPTDWLFTAKVGEYSPVYDTQNDFRVIRSDGVIPAGTAPLADVYTLIERKLQVKEQEKLAVAKAQEIYDRITTGESLEKACAADNIEVQESPYFSRSSRIQGMGQDPNFIGAAFTLSEANKYSRPILTKTGAAVLEYVDRVAAKLDNFESQRDSLRAQEERTMRSAYWDAWFKGLIDEAKIQDYRRDIYGDKM